MPRVSVLAAAALCAVPLLFGAPRPKMLDRPISIYNNWAAYDELSDNVELTEELAMRQLDELLRLRALGVRFDAYVMDAYWFAKDGGYRTWRKPHWPNGPDAWLKKCRENGIKPGIWIGTNTLSGLEPVPEWKSSMNSSGKAMCLFRGQFLAHLTETMQIWYDRGVRVYKFDFAEFSAATPDVASMPAADIREANEKAFREALVKFRDRNREAVLVAFNGFGGDQLDTATPFRKSVDLRWLDAFDALYCGDPRPADVPAMNFWRSKDIYTDHMVRRYEENRIPLERIDNTGFMIGTTGTCYKRRTAAWKGMLLLELARGGWVNTYYGNLELLDREDASFFAKAQAMFYPLQALGRTRTIGSIPGEEQPYGFVSLSPHGSLYTAVNPGQSIATLKLERFAGDPPARQGRILFHDAGYRPTLKADSITLGPEQMAVIGFGHYAGAAFDLGVQEDVIIPASIEALDAKWTPDGSGSIQATFTPPTEGDLRIVIRQKRPDGQPVRTTGGSPPKGTTLGNMLTLSARQGGRTIPVEIRYDKAIWSGLSWAVGEIRASDLRREPLTIRFTTTEKSNPSLEGAVYRVVYAHGRK
jgi:hypothetical protein